MSVLVAMHLTGYDLRWLRGVRILLSCWVAVPLTLVWTNELHHWFWIDYRLEPSRISCWPVHGPAFQIYQGGAFAFVLTTIAL